MTTLFAQPYNLDATGFYFTSQEEYQVRYDTNRDHWGQPVEEYEIQMIESDNDGDGELFDVLGIGQGNLEQWFDDVEGKNSHEKSMLFYLVSCAGYGLADALEKIDEVSLFSGRLLEAATDLFDECYAHEIPENLRTYIDYDAFANDCRCNGDMVEFRFAGEDWTCINANGI